MNSKPDLLPRTTAATSLETPCGPILVTGAHRTGTTWVGKMLAAGGETAYISEPLNVLHRPGVLRIPIERWYTYICPENEAEFLPALRETLSYRYHLLAELGSLRSGKDLLRMGRDWGIFMGGRLYRRRPLLKDPFAVFSAGWFADRLGCQVVCTVRHPAAFASSLKRLDWPFQFGDLLEQDLLVRDWLEPYEAEIQRAIAAPGDVVGEAALLWKIIYSVIAQLQAGHPDLLVVRHEDLSLDPEGGFRQLYAALGLSFTGRAREQILNASSSENPKEVSPSSVHSVRLDSRTNLHNWKHRLTPEETRKVRDIAGEAAEPYYPDAGWS
jgi:hypothetical protein